MDGSFEASWEPIARRDVLMTLGIDPAVGTGLEIGAANNPLIPPHVGDCRYVDYTDTDGLRQRLSQGGYPHVGNVIEIDYVWAGSGSLEEVVGPMRFDYALASHVIEHVPNPIGWLRGISQVLKPGGVFNLAIPDRRFTFDVAAPESTVGQLVEAFLLEYTQPSPRQIFDFCYYGKAIEPGAIWKSPIDIKKAPAYSGDLSTQLSFDNAQRSLAGIYFDTHCWIVTPSSFLDLIDGLCRLELFDYLLEDYHPTVDGEFEFFLSLRKPSEDLGRDDLRIQQLQKIEYFRTVLSERRRALLLLAE